MFGIIGSKAQYANPLGGTRGFFRSRFNKKVLHFERINKKRSKEVAYSFREVLNNCFGGRK